MASWFVRPDTRTLPLSEGQTITVKKRLNNGEERAMFARMYVAGVDGLLRVNYVQSGFARVVAYLLDWSLVGEDGKKVPIQDQPVEVVEAALNALAPEHFGEIRRAIEQHEKDMDAEREAEKNGQGGATVSPAISPLRSDAAGGTSGSAISTAMSIAS